MMRLSACASDLDGSRPRCLWPMDSLLAYQRFGDIPDATLNLMTVQVRIDPIGSICSNLSGSLLTRDGYRLNLRLV